jgi:hypothetical protein
LLDTVDAAGQPVARKFRGVERPNE